MHCHTHAIAVRGRSGPLRRTRPFALALLLLFAVSAGAQDSGPAGEDRAALRHTQLRAKLAEMNIKLAGAVLQVKDAKQELDRAVAVRRVTQARVDQVNQTLSRTYVDPGSIEGRENAYALAITAERARLDRIKESLAMQTAVGRGPLSRTEQAAYERTIQESKDRITSLQQAMIDPAKPAPPVARALQDLRRNSAELMPLLRQRLDRQDTKVVLARGAYDTALARQADAAFQRLGFLSIYFGRSIGSEQGALVPGYLREISIRDSGGVIRYRGLWEDLGESDRISSLESELESLQRMRTHLRGNADAHRQEFLKIAAEYEKAIDLYRNRADAHALRKAAFEMFGAAVSVAVQGGTPEAFGGEALSQAMKGVTRLSGSLPEINFGGMTLNLLRDLNQRRGNPAVYAESIYGIGARAQRAAAQPIKSSPLYSEKFQADVLAIDSGEVAEFVREHVAKPVLINSGIGARPDLYASLRAAGRITPTQWNSFLSSNGRAVLGDLAGTAAAAPLVRMSQKMLNEFFMKAIVTELHWLTARRNFHEVMAFLHAVEERIAAVSKKLADEFAANRDGPGRALVASPSEHLEPGKYTVELLFSTEMRPTFVGFGRRNFVATENTAPAVKAVVPLEIREEELAGQERRQLVLAVTAANLGNPDAGFDSGPATVSHLKVEFDEKGELSPDSLESWVGREGGSDRSHVFGIRAAAPRPTILRRVRVRCDDQAVYHGAWADRGRLREFTAEDQVLPKAGAVVATFEFDQPVTAFAPALGSVGASRVPIRVKSGSGTAIDRRWVCEFDAAKLHEAFDGGGTAPFLVTAKGAGGMVIDGGPGDVAEPFLRGSAAAAGAPVTWRWYRQGADASHVLRLAKDCLPPLRPLPHTRGLPDPTTIHGASHSTLERVLLLTPATEIVIRPRPFKKHFHGTVRIEEAFAPGGEWRRVTSYGLHTGEFDEPFFYTSHSTRLTFLRVTLTGPEEPVRFDVTYHDRGDIGLGLDLSKDRTVELPLDRNLVGYLNMEYEYAGRDIHDRYQLSYLREGQTVTVNLGRIEAFRNSFIETQLLENGLPLPERGYGDVQVLLRHVTCVAGKPVHGTAAHGTANSHRGVDLTFKVEKSGTYWLDFEGRYAANMRYMFRATVSD